MGGFFVGMLLSIVGIVLASTFGSKRTFEFEHAFLGGLVASIIGLIWGSVVGICNPNASNATFCTIDDEVHTTRAAPSLNE